MQRDGVRWLNNLVAELVNLKSLPPRSRVDSTFIHPRHGWLLVRSTVIGNGKVWIGLDTGAREKAIIVHARTTPETQETMRFLPAGEHTITVWREGEAIVRSLVVRVIPELIFCKFRYDPHIVPHGPYDWRFLQRHVLSHINVIVGGGDDEHRPFVEEFKEQGKRWIVEVPATPYFQRMPADEAYRFWAHSAGMKEPLYDGIIVDEFFGGDDRHYEAITESVRRICRNRRFLHKAFYPYCVNMFGARMSEEFVRAVIECGYPIAWERYLPEQPTEEKAKALLESDLSGDMRKWQAAFPGCEKRMIICLGYLQMITTESLNVDPQVDFKVWMDMQFRHIATDPAFFGTFGLMEYTSGYADEETVRWAAKLYRHYGIEGRTSLLSEHYGFQYRLKHLVNPDFAEGTKGWTVEAAEQGSVDVKRYEGYSWLEGRFPRTVQGDTFLWMKRSGKKPNVVAQEVKNLRPGRLYSLKMVTADYRDLMEGKSAEQMHAISIGLRGVELLPDKCFQFAIPNNYAHHLGAFNDKNRFWMNYHHRVFRAKSSSAHLTLSDWAKETEPVGPVGQELMFNFVEVQPYLEE